jgi:hypothetical protein
MPRMIAQQIAVALTPAMQEQINRGQLRLKVA